jgi:membrane-associated phospholipid phosphatase
MRRILPALLLFIFSSFYCLAQNNTGDTNGKNKFRERFMQDSLWSFRSPKGIIPSLFHNLKYQALFPARISEKQSVMLMGAAGLTATLYYYDSEIDAKMRPLKDNHRWIHDLSPQLTELGDYYGYSFLVLSGAFSLVTKNHKLLHTSILAGEAALCAGIWARFAKTLTGRMRPGATYGDREYNSDHWFGPFGEFDLAKRRGRGIGAFDSFPSGHTAAAFSIAGVFASRYSDRKAVGWIAYTLATTVAITRMIEHEHWASDLIPGAIIGYACSRQVMNHYKQLFPEYSNGGYDRNKKRSGSLSLFPMTSRPGLYCILSF